MRSAGIISIATGDIEGAFSILIVGDSCTIIKPIGAAGIDHWVRAWHICTSSTRKWYCNTVIVGSPNVVQWNVWFYHALLVDRNLCVLRCVLRGWKTLALGSYRFKSSEDLDLDLSRSVPACSLDQASLGFGFSGIVMHRKFWWSTAVVRFADVYRSGSVIKYVDLDRDNFG